MYPNKQVDDLRKAGHLGQALKLGRDLLKENPNDKYLRNSVGWVLHDQIKCDVTACEVTISQLIVGAT